MTKKFTAIHGTTSRITSVIAENANEADMKLENQMRKPGRFIFFEAWINSGRRMMVNNNRDEIVSAS